METQVEKTEDKTQKTSATTGEKWFSALRFAAGEGIILFLTAVLAYVARYGKDSYGPVPNYLKKFQGWMTDKLLNNKVLPLGKNPGSHSERLAHIIAGTTILMHGGNAFTPVMKVIEDRKERIVTYINDRWGKPGEVEAGKANVRAEPKQTWGDLVKGRLIAWGVVFLTFVGADWALGQNKSTGKYNFDMFEDWFGKGVAKITSKGRGAIQNGTHEANNTYRFGKILALDIYATAAALVVWITTSKIFAMLRGKKTLQQPTESADPIIEVAKELTEAKGNSREPTQPQANASRQKLVDAGPKPLLSRAEVSMEPSHAIA